MSRQVGARYGLEIRSAGVPDAPGIVELLESVGIGVPVGRIEARLDGLRRGPGAVLLALEWGPPSGLIWLTWFPVIDADLPVAQIDTLLVGPDHRRRGIGRMLLKAGAQAARAAGCGEMRLILPTGASDLEAFGAATGFGGTARAVTRSLRKRP